MTMNIEEYREELHYRRPNVWRTRLIAAFLLLLVGGAFVLNTLSRCDDAGARTLEMQMVEDYALRLHGGESREHIEKMIGRAQPHASFPGWDAAYDLGPKGISFNPQSDWLLLRYKDGLLVERTITKAPSIGRN